MNTMIAAQQQEQRRNHSMTQQTTTVGQFTIENGELSGPADYMCERGKARLESILAGNDPVFNMGLRHSPSPETAMLVSLQTDFAGWKGERQLREALEVAA